MESSSFKTKPEPQDGAADHDTDLWAPERLFTKQMADVVTTLPMSNLQSVTPHHLITTRWRSFAMHGPPKQTVSLHVVIETSGDQSRRRLFTDIFLHVDKVASVGGDSATGRPTICHISLSQAATESG